MGPQARWLHAMAFDSTRSRLVLFGGTPALARDSSLGDTWEVDGPGTNPGGGVVLTQLVVERGNGLNVVTGQVTLSGPAPSGGVMVELSFDPFPQTGGWDAVEWSARTWTSLAPPNLRWSL